MRRDAQNGDAGDERHCKHCLLRDSFTHLILKISTLLVAFVCVNYAFTDNLRSPILASPSIRTDGTISFVVVYGKWGPLTLMPPPSHFHFSTINLKLGLDPTNSVYTPAGKGKHLISISRPSMLQSSLYLTDIQPSDDELIGG
jgi:hypothetical protein